MRRGWTGDSWTTLLRSAAAVLLLAWCGTAAGFTVSVTDSSGAPVNGFRWLVEEDTTFAVYPGLQTPDALALQFHKSYMPVVASGHTESSSAGISVTPGTDYYVSVLPDAGFTLGGARVSAAGEDVSVVVNALPLPTAQITVFVFHDNHPINNTPDIPEEGGLAGFRVNLLDAGGRYGMAGGQMMMDAFGNPLGSSYDANGNLEHMGNGYLLTDSEGRAKFENLAPGKYTAEVIAPIGQNWVQTSTIEGGKGIDAWVKTNEPGYFAEFGPPGEHVAFGFIQPMNDTTVLSGGATITGRIVNLHNSRPPDYTFHAGHPWPGAWVGLNDMAVAGGRAVFAGPCDDESRFSIPNVPAGNYVLAIWDENLDILFALHALVVEDGQDLSLGDVPVFNWFGRMRTMVFHDEDEDGFRDPAEEGISDQLVNLRWRDGTMYNSMGTDLEGMAPFEEVFPFFNWQVAEVDFTRFKATGATVVVDNGGPVLPDQGWTYPSWGELTPQPQFEADGVTPLNNPHTDNNLSRTEAGPVLTQAFQVFLGQTNVIEFGKSSYDRVDTNAAPYDDFPGPGDTDLNGNGLFDSSNGGISGVVQYATTRAEADPRMAAAEVWEPGIPRVQVNLYVDNDRNNIIDDTNGDGLSTLADVDNHPFENFPGPEDIDRPENGDGVYNAAHGDVDNEPTANFPGPEDIDRPENGDGAYNVNDGDADRMPFGNFPGPEDLDRPSGGSTQGDGIFDYGDALSVVTTDSWDDNLPTGAQGPPYEIYGMATDCFDGLRNFNQVRPGVFDGGYAFNSYMHEGVEVPGLPEGEYIVEAVPPPGYEILKEEDVNVAFGETYTPAEKAAAPMAKAGALLLPPSCVGDAHLVPDELALFPGESCDFAGQVRPLSDRKRVVLLRGLNAACNFFLFTEVPISGHIVGMILNDLANEYDPNAPTFGEKQAPAWLPISIRDWKGNEISRVYCDEWGTYNALVPSTFSANLPMPSGMSPSMLTVILNHPGPIIDTREGSPTHGQYITDPFFSRQYSQFSYTFQYMPGTTTYLDTPVLPLAAYTGPGQYPVDAEMPGGTPVIWSVQNASGEGPYVQDFNSNITITSAGTVEVSNPLYDPDTSQPPRVPRDFGFGSQGPNSKVTLGGVELPIVNWTDDVITATIPEGAQTSQLLVTRDNGRTSVMGVTLTVAPFGGEVINVYPSGNPNATPIQNAIDAASAGDLILVAPGQYNELVIMWKPVQLQGWGAASVTINAVKVPAERIQAWRDKAEALVRTGSIDLLPSQSVLFGGIEPGALFTEEGPGIMVFARNATQGNGGFGANPRARIDGLTVTGGDHAGGIIVNGYARYLEISNNRVTANQGLYTGGIRVGHPDLQGMGVFDGEYEHGRNDHIRIHNNHIAGNGGLGAAGGGIGLFTGTDYYEVSDNYIVANFTVGDGAGIGHLGRSTGGKILNNVIVFNQSFNQGAGASGGGIYVGGATPIAAGLTHGAGSVEINGNLIQGNNSGAGDGGGIRLQQVNGQDVQAAPDNPSLWYKVDVVNNIVVNNVAGLAGGGISLQDAVRVNIVNNTIAHNDSTATAGLAFAPGSPNLSTAQPAGLVSRAHSPLLAVAFGASPGVLPYAEFSNPLLTNNIIWKNRTFHFYVNSALNPPFGLAPNPDSPDYDDLGVLGTAAPALLSPRYCVLTNAGNYPGAFNISTDPLFQADYFNGDRGQTLLIPEVNTSIAAVPAFDEGGNFIDMRFGPLTLNHPATGQAYGNYHLQNGSPALGAGTIGLLPSMLMTKQDFDGQTRPNGGLDIGADEYHAGAGGNTPPVPLPEKYSVRRGIWLHVNAPGVLANDWDAEGDPITAILVSGPTRGTLTFRPNGSFDYLSTGAFTGTVTFTYKASDGSAESPPATVSIRVLATNPNAPVGVVDNYTMIRDTTLEVPGPGVLANDTDPNNDTLTAVLFVPVTTGSLTLWPDGGFRYTPPAGFTGNVTFRYRPYDGLIGQSATVNIRVTVPPGPDPNTPPNPQATAIVTTMNVPNYTRVLANDPDINDVHAYAVSTPPTHGAATITDTGIAAYTPQADYIGSDQFIVTVTDSRGATGAVTVDVTVAEMFMPPHQSGVVRQFKEDTDGIDTDGDGIIDNDNVMLHLGAGDGFAKMADGYELYMFGFSDLTDVMPEHSMMEGMLAGETPAPTIVVREGQKLYLNLTNVGMHMRPDLFDPHSVHWHGFPEAAPVFDGVPDASISINMGGTVCYYYNVVRPGTYMYHCHVEATEHMQMGMLGNLYVTPKQDGQSFTWNGRTYTKFAYNDGDGSTGYDVAYPLQLGSWDPDFHDASVNVQPLPFAMMQDKYALLNGRGYPDTTVATPLAPPAENGGKVVQKESSLISANSGERVLLRVSNLNVTRFYTLSSPAIPMQVVARDARLLRSTSGVDMYHTANSVDLGSGETADVLLDLANVAPGTYPLYTTNLNYLSNNQQDFGGMMTEIVVH